MIPRASVVYQTTPSEGIQTNTASSVTSSQITVTSETDDLVVDGIRCGSDPTEDGSQTNRSALTNAGHFTESSTEVGAASVDMDWTFSSDTVAHAGVNLNAAVVAGTRRVFSIT